MVKLAEWLKSQTRQLYLIGRSECSCPSGGVFATNDLPVTVCHALISRGHPITAREESQEPRPNHPAAAPC